MPFQSFLNFEMSEKGDECSDEKNVFSALRIMFSFNDKGFIVEGAISLFYFIFDSRWLLLVVFLKKCLICLASAA